MCQSGSDRAKAELDLAILRHKRRIRRAAGVAFLVGGGLSMMMYYTDTIFDNFLYMMLLFVLMLWTGVRVNGEYLFKAPAQTLDGLVKTWWRRQTFLIDKNGSVYYQTGVFGKTTTELDKTSHMLLKPRKIRGSYLEIANGDLRLRLFVGKSHARLRSNLKQAGWDLV
jgi:hypothetical protein